MESEHVLVILHSGFLLAATVASAESNIQLKLSSIARKVNADIPSRYPNKCTILGIFLSCVAGLADLMAMRHVPFSVKSCISSLMIPITALLARVQLGESASRTQWLGIVTAVAGTSAGLLCASHDAPVASTIVLLSRMLSLRTAVLVFVTVTLFGLSLKTLRASPSEQVNRSLGYLAGSAYATSFVAACASLLARFVATMLSEYGAGSVAVWAVMVGMVGVCVVQMMLMTAMLAKFDATVCVPTYQIFNTIWLAIISSVLFLESPANSLGFVGGILLSSLGIWMIAAPSYKKSDDGINFEPLSIIEELSPIL